MYGDKEFLEYNNYLRKKAKNDPNFAINDCFSISDDEINKCKEIINEIEDKIHKIKKAKDFQTRNELNKAKGKLLEDLAEILLGSADIFTLKKNVRDHTNEIDNLLTPTDYNKLHNILLPDYLKDDILVECKNYNNKISVDWVGKFSSLINTHSVNLGIIFSFKEFAGPGEWKSSKGLAKKIFLAEKKAIININFNDIEKILSKEMNIVEMIIYKYEALRHQVDYSKLITVHPAEQS